MARRKCSKIFSFFLYLYIITSITIHQQLVADLSSLAKNDPYPVFSTLNRDDAFLLTKQQLYYKDEELADEKHSRVGLSITPFGQNASRGKSIKGQPCPIPFCDLTLIPTPSACDIPCPDEADVPLGDLTGRSGMIALLYGQIPVASGYTTLPGGPAPEGYLSTAYEKFFPGQQQGIQSNGGNIDPLQQFGFFSFPLEYRKRGIRFELSALFANNFGVRVQTGVSSIRQVVERVINKTCDPTITTECTSHFTPVTTTITPETVNTLLMDQLDNITTQMGTDISNIIQTSCEEVRFNMFWRQIFDMNSDTENEWTRFLLIPYFEASGSFSPSKPRSPNQLFAVPFGNNGHTSVGFTTGINFDFIETIELGGEIGFTHFFKRDFCNYPVPNNKYQTTLFPFKTNVSVQPGNNWYFCARIAAYHFLGNLSMNFEWFVLDHKQDSIKLEIPDAAFLPGLLENTTTFKTKFANASLNYDIAPNIGIGFLWQIPFSQRNAYRSSTIMGGVNFTF